MTTATQTEAVLLVDLREETGDQVDVKLWEILHNHRVRYSHRVLVVDDVLTLADHDSVFETLLGSKGVQVVCVAVGPPQGPGSGPVLKVPGSLNNDDAATLWVGNQDGIGWDIQRDTTVAPERIGVPDRPLRILLEVLRIPNVFDAVAGLAGDFPGRTSNPGLLVEASPIGPDELVVAQIDAMRRVAGSDRHTAAGETPAPEADLRKVLLGDPDLPLASIVREPVPKSTVDRLFQNGLKACRRATDGVEALAGPIGPALTAPSDAAGLVAQAGAAVREYRQFVADRFGRMGGRVGLKQDQHESLRRDGLDTTPPRGTDRDAITARMRELVDEALDSEHSLDAIAGRLRRISEQSAPMGSGAHLEELDRRCPQAMVDRLAAPVAFPLRPIEPWVLAAVAGCGLLAGLLHWVASAVLAVLWVAGLLLALDRRPGRPARWSGPDTAAVLVNALAVAAGGAVAGVVRSAVPVPVAVGVASAAIAVVAAVLVLRYWWYGAVRRWVAVLGITQAAEAVVGMHQLLMDVAVREWAMSGARRFTADAAARMANQVTTAAALLNLRAAEYRPGGSGRPPRLAPGAPAIPPELVEIITADLVDAVRSALQPCWDQVQFVGAQTNVDVRQLLADLLDEYRAHLQMRGVDQKPSFSTRSMDRSRIAGIMWQRSPLVERLLQKATVDEPMLQLCSGDELRVLTASDAGTRLVRFAPQPVRSALASEAGMERELGGLADLEWTESVHLAGALRLVPLRYSGDPVVWSRTEEPGMPGDGSD